ncbi:hypothetical protein [Candidatus Hepatobacter penaei]|uniref:hypothetical protein n=1 Tax=Candidatus Hepatobacter penaei TaxID=1274402 RepID=UPI0012E065AD|nr:hypothetical protein [Candidatus Hepatobacter penaei]
MSHFLLKIDIGLALSLVLSMMYRFSFMGVVLTGFSFMGFGSLTAMDQDDVSPNPRPSLSSERLGPSDHEDVWLVGSSVQDDPRPLASEESVSEPVTEGAAVPALREAHEVTTQADIIRNSFHKKFADLAEARKAVERIKDKIANHGKDTLAKRWAFVRKQFEQGNHPWDDFNVSEERYPNNPEAREIREAIKVVDREVEALREEAKKREVRVEKQKSAINEHIDLMVKEGLLTKDEAYGEYSSLAVINSIVQERFS